MYIVASLHTLKVLVTWAFSLEIMDFMQSEFLTVYIFSSPLILFPSGAHSPLPMPRTYCKIS